MKKVLSVLAICLMLGACSFSSGHTYSVNGQEVSKSEYEAHKVQIQEVQKAWRQERKERWEAGERPDIKGLADELTGGRL